MLDILRNIRSSINFFSEMQVMGIHIDWFFHLTGIAIFVLVGSMFLTLRKTIQLAVGLILAKELFDIFAKTRLEYIRPPTIDILFDLTAGVLGIYLGIWLSRQFGRRGWLKK